MITSLHEQAIIVPADIAICGTTATMSFPKQSRK